MKYLKTIIIAIAIYFPIVGNAQAVTQILQAIKPSKPFAGTKILVKGSSIIQAGIGFPNNAGDFLGVGGIGNSLLGIKKTGAGPFFFSYEYLAKDELGIGVNIAYASATITSSTNSDILGSVNGSFSLMQIGVSTTYHIYTTNKIDPYARAMVGVNITHKKDASTTSNILYSLPSAIAYQGLVGLRYFAAPKIAIVGELSYSALKFSANIGIGYKLK